MTTIALVVLGVATASFACALMLCVAAARADRRLRSAMLDALGWSPQDEWALVKTEHSVRYKQRAAS
jgi:hypothetical protein